MHRNPLDLDLTRPAVLATGPFPSRIEVTEGLFRPADSNGTAQIVDSERFLVDLGTTWAQSLTKANGRDKALDCFCKMARAMRFYLTGGAAVPAADLPNSNGQVLPAVAAVEKVFPIIREEARFAVRGLPLDDLRVLTAMVEGLMGLRTANDGLQEDLDGLIALCLSHLHEIVRVFDHKTAALIEDDSEVGTLLAPVDILLRGAARRAAQSRKANDKNAERIGTRAESAAKAGLAAPGTADPQADKGPVGGASPPGAARGSDGKNR